MPINSYEPHLAAAYDRGAAQYRRDDEIEARTENHQRLGGNLRRICRSFSQPIRVLEIGCGTGRYFHWLENVTLLVGTDLSEEMLRHARQPLQNNEVTAGEIRLAQGSIYEMDFEPESFDFIYSLGVFGYGAAWTPALAAKVHQWLAPGGRLFFNAVEEPPSSGRISDMKKSVRAGVYPHLPVKLQRWLDARDTVPLRLHSRQELERVMDAAGFVDYMLTSHACRSSLWTGVHLECSARKALAAKEVAARHAPEVAGSRLSILT